MTSLPPLSETDLMLCLLEIWYDTTWAYYMSTNVDHVAKRLSKNKRRKIFSGSASVSTASSFVEDDDGVAGKSFQEKLYRLEENLRQVETRMNARHFEEICDRLTSGNDDHPWNHTLEIAKSLLETQSQFMREELEELTFPAVFQVLYYQMCDFLLKHPEGMKLVIAPTNKYQDTYDVCRYKFCRLMSEETSIIQDGLSCLVNKLRNVSKTPSNVTMFRFPTIELSSSDDSDSDSDSDSDESSL